MREPDGTAALDLVIGLINNMPAAAKRATEQQFDDLLVHAARGLGIRIGFFVVDDYARTTRETFHLLHDMRPDALIVTGDEPQRLSVMSDEPLWPALARLVDWAGTHTISSVWSCFAAHAAVLRLDGINRTRRPQKLSGMYPCAAASDDPLLANFPSSWLVPHSRHNGVDETALESKDYTVLSRSPQVGVDSFAKRIRGSLFLFLQGHPEYAPDSLLREYRRDIRRFLAGERETYPGNAREIISIRTPRANSEKLREQAYRAPSPRLLSSVYAAFIDSSLSAENAAALPLYTNWLGYLCPRESQPQHNSAPWPVEQERGAA